MDRTAGDKAPQRPSIPRLPLHICGAETPSHFDLESLQLTTCRSESEDFVLPTSFRTSRGRNDSLFKIPSQLERLTGLLDCMMDSLKDSPPPEAPDLCPLQALERAMMRLEDATASEWRHREEKLDLCRELQDAKEQLSLSCIESGDTLQSPQNCKDKSLLETIVVTEMRQLKRHIENLTGRKIAPVHGNHWEHEFPLFVRTIIEAVSSLLRPKPEPAADFPQSVLKVTCSADDLQSVVAKVGEILEDFEATGGTKEFGIQLGAVGVTVRVEGEVTELPQEMVEVLAEQIACGEESRDSEKSGSPGSKEDQSSYIRQLEEKVAELQSVLATDHFEVPTDTMATELESKLEEAMYKLTLANKQIERLKQTKSVSEVSESLGHNYKLKLAEAMLREEKLKEGCAKLALEKEKLRLQYGRLEEEKENLLQQLSLPSKPLSNALVQTSPLSSPQSSPQPLNISHSHWTQSCSPLAQHLTHIYEEVEKGTESALIMKELREIRELVGRNGRRASESEEEWMEEVEDQEERLDRERERTVLMAEMKEKEQVVENLRETLHHADHRLSQALSEVATLKEERIFALKAAHDLDELKHTLATFLSAKSADLDAVATERKAVEVERKELEMEREKFRLKRDMLREKVEMVNERQRKVSGKEKLLTEKETLLQLEEKKITYHKQAVDQLWTENEEKRRELQKCHKVIEDEWKLLMEETRQFEGLKLADKRVKLDWNDRERELETQADQLQALALKINQEKTALAQAKLQLESGFSELVKSKQSLFDRIKRCEVAHSEVTLDRLTLARQKAEVETNRRDLVQMIPAIQRLLS